MQDSLFQGGNGVTEHGVILEVNLGGFEESLAIGTLYGR
jgi:hypothetical protein